MSFSWPWALMALLVVPFVLGLAWWARRRRRRAAVRVTSIAVVRSALPGRSRWTRRIPAALLVTALLLLGIGVARPQATVPVASDSTTIMLALDTSGSMCSTDVEPNRLTVAQAAAVSFVRSQEGGARIGLVTFAGVAGLLVPPTDDTEELVAAIEGLSTARGTAIGSAILTGIDGLAEIDSSIAPTGADVSETSVALAGEFAPSIIVVLTDGANTQGVDPQTAAAEAAARGVRVYTIGFGTTTPAQMVCTGQQVSGWGGGGGGGYGGGGRGGGRNFMTIDEPSLQAVAETTGGEYYRAESADQLLDVMADLPSHVTVVNEKIDLAAWFAAAAGLLVAAAVGLSLWWNRVRMPAGRRARGG